MSGSSRHATAAGAEAADRNSRPCYNPVVLERLTIDDFRPLAGSAFRVADGSIALRLERVAAVMESERARLTRQPFSLFFRGPTETPLSQGIHSLEHDSFPEPLPIFLVPVGRNAEGWEYEAVFT
jgi:hypothetical protein